MLSPMRLGLCLLLTACSSTPVTPAVDAGTDSGDVPLEKCDLHAGGGTMFQDATMAWGLAGIVGNRITSADLDGDGYPDLVVSANAPNKHNQPVKVLMNRPSAGGRTFVDMTQASGFFQVRGGTPGDT